jgi:hypothetical protein
MSTSRSSRFISKLRIERLISSIMKWEKHTRGATAMHRELTIEGMESVNGRFNHEWPVIIWRHVACCYDSFGCSCPLLTVHIMGRYLFCSNMATLHTIMSLCLYKSSLVSYSTMKDMSFSREFVLRGTHKPQKAINLHHLSWYFHATPPPLEVHGGPNTLQAKRLPFHLLPRRKTPNSFTRTKSVIHTCQLTAYKFLPL